MIDVGVTRDQDDVAPFRAVTSAKRAQASAQDGSVGRIEDGLEQLAWGQTSEFRPQVCQSLGITTDQRWIGRWLVTVCLPMGYLNGLST
jgi:hypothetical protein